MTIVYALKLAKQYCEFNGLDGSKLDTLEYMQYTDRYKDVIWFAAPLTEGQQKLVGVDGLMHDIDTQPYPLLAVYDDGTVEETEYTREYLSK